MAIEEKIEYRYFVTDLLSNEILAEIPFKDVSYKRVIRRAGDFSGKIPFIEATKGLNLYETTMPGRTGLYIIRNGTCVWGGIIWARSYDVISKELSVDASEFMSYFYHRHIWQTLIYGSPYLGVYSYSLTNGVATVITETPHGFSAGRTIKITYTSPLVDGIHEVKSIVSANTFTFDVSVAAPNTATVLITSGTVRGLVDTFDFVRDILFRTATDLAGINFANEIIKPAATYSVPVISKRRSSGTVTLETSGNHELVIGQEITTAELGSDLNGTFIVTGTPTSTSFTYELNGPDIARTTLPGIKTLNITSKRLDPSPTVDAPERAIATITTSEAHGASVGQNVFLEGVDSFFNDRLDNRYDGQFQITSIANDARNVGTPSGRTLSFLTTGILSEPRDASGLPDSISGGTANFGSRVTYGDYGSFSYNSDIQLSVDNQLQSGLYQEQQVYRGFELKTVGDILEEYSENINGFEYRIDCDYDYDTASFTRTFVLLDIDNPVEVEEGGVPDITRFGADQIVFEYPGNISSFSINESAEDSATRMFTTGKIGDISGDASQPYAAASAKDLLNNPNGKSWPILDQVESIDGVSDEDELYSYAQDYLYESRPPISEFDLEINGSLTPTVGSYYPGDWCSIIVNDEFVRLRRASDQEPRDDILIRKIVAYEVNVPDSPHFPEKVKLELINDWKVEQGGN
jgi:hypothetical protein